MYSPEKIFKVLNAIRQIADEADEHGNIEFDLIAEQLKPKGIESKEIKGILQSLDIGLKMDAVENKTQLQEVLSYIEVTERDIDEYSNSGEIIRHVISLGKDFEKYYRNLKKSLDRKIYNVYTNNGDDELNKTQIDTYRKPSHRAKYDVFVDEERREVFINGKQVSSFQPRSFDLLKYFIQSIDKAKTNNDIIQKNWKHPEAVGHQALHQAITRLRKDTNKVLNPFLKGEAGTYCLRSEVMNVKKIMKLKYCLISSQQ